MENVKSDSNYELRGEAGLVNLLRTAVEQTVEDNGWLHLGQVGQCIRTIPRFHRLIAGMDIKKGMDRKTICFSKNEDMHDKVIGPYIIN